MGLAALAQPPRGLRRNSRRLLAIGLTVLGVVAWLPFILWPVTFDTATDAHAYFVGDDGVGWGGTDSFVYSPAFDQIIEPLRWLGWDGFRTAWRLLEVGSLALMAGPLTALGLFVRPIAVEVNIGNIHLMLGLAIVAGFRWPWIWSFVLLTKVTPGIGLLWFGIRREWRELAIALGATGAIAAVSFVIAPSDWFAWLAILSAPPVEAAAPIVTAPLVVRLVLAGALITWGAPRGDRWTVLAAAFLALPLVWETALAMLVGLWALRRPASGRSGGGSLPVDRRGAS